MKRFAHISDVHADEISDYWYEPGVTPCVDIVAHLNTLGLDFVMDTADIVDRYSAANLLLYKSWLSGLSVPLYNVVGNHDEDNGASWGEGGCFDHPDTCLLNYESIIGNKHPVFDADGYRFIGIHIEYWPTMKARIIEAELAYLEGQLQSLDGQLPLVFGHYPATTEFVTGGGLPELLALFSAYGVRAYFSGHTHRDPTFVLTGNTYHCNTKQLRPNTLVNNGMLICDLYETGMEVEYRYSQSPFDLRWKQFVPFGVNNGVAMPTSIASGRSARRGIPIQSGQVTSYHAGDIQPVQKGLAKKYQVNSAGAQSGNTAVDVLHYVAATLSFTAATKTIADSAGQLATVKTGDTLVIVGSGSNDGTYTVATGNVAGSVVVVESLVNESAGAYVHIYKRIILSNNTVLDANTQLEWYRYTSNGYKFGSASLGHTYWYNPVSVWLVHPAAGDLQFIAPNILRIVNGAGELNRYKVGDLLVFAGFATPINNTPGFYATGVAVNGADLDISLNVFGLATVSEAAGGSRSISIATQHLFSYMAAVNKAALGGYSDWRIPILKEFVDLLDDEAPSGVPDATAFPGWTGVSIWLSSTNPANTAQAHTVQGTSAQAPTGTKTASCYCALVRGGI